MTVKNFKHEQNQNLWEQYYNYRLQDATGKDENKIKLSINQYKPGILALEELTDKQFSDITAQDIETTIQQREGKNANHINAFFITVISQDWLKVNKELIVYLIPKEYRMLVKILMD